MKLFVISVEDKPGMVAEICEAVRPSKIKYIATQKSGYGKGFVKIVTTEDEIARSNLAGKKYMFIEEPLVLVKTDGSSEDMYDLTNKVGSQGINIENMFAMEPGVLAMIIGPNDLNATRQLLGDQIV